MKLKKKTYIPFLYFVLSFSKDEEVLLRNPFFMQLACSLIVNESSTQGMSNSAIALRTIVRTLPFALLLEFLGIKTVGLLG